MPVNRSPNLLYPPFYALIKRGLEQARAEGLVVYIYEGYRSFERQEQLYAQGRTAPGAKVTWAQPGNSLHAYGLAVDLVFDGLPAEGVQWDWSGDYNGDKKGDYAKLAVIMKIQGLEWLGDSNTEQAHFQKTWGASIDKIKSAFKSGGVLGVWVMLDELVK